MIKKERERVGRLEKTIEPANNVPDPVSPQSHAVFLRQVTQRATTQHPSRVMSPPTDVDFSRGLPTPVTDVPSSPLPMAIIGSDLPGASDKRVNSLDHIPHQAYTTPVYRV
ncbi:hypothetical protein P691DRAFT_804968 [Macrolepiota fuliginosa MF-IS2]|uniref:Uncharacterized protein n=1 Tax=Macrolepiota fuliginosa MF-IS2 TaxID=1400762 RepID=A0A9P6C235_9AGAR|nr:hypothetical protein P691DRAFT_804968 [Macrolepiota fuliginosa MF-IS2]